MAQSSSQLFLLADHVKLSLLERQRAKALQIDSRTQDAEISGSLESLRVGLLFLGNGHTDAHAIQQQYNDLFQQFHGSAAISSTPVTPNNPALADDFAKAQTARYSDAVAATSTVKKSVRFRDAQDEANRAALLPYRDDPEEAPDHGHLDNQQIHDYHADIIRRQDQELDTLGASIGRQRELSMRIGDELEEQVEILDHVDGHVDRHQTQLDRAKTRLGGVARQAKENMGLTIITILILILVLLLIIL